jgi:hypothetical protein
MKILSSLRVLGLCMFVGCDAFAGSGSAIAIGLNGVDLSKYNGWDGELNLCESDAEAMAKIARNQGFQTTTLLTKKATLANVKAAITKAAGALQSGDTFVLSFAGHGGQVKDQNGDENTDETWCLYDGQLIDDELGLLWTKFREGVRIILYSDSCHSGTVLKVADAAAISTKFRVREIPREIQRQIEGQWKDAWRALPSNRVSEGKTVASVLSITACDDSETSIELRDGKNGLFTERLVQIWANGAFKNSYSDFHRKIRSEVKNAAQAVEHEQTPQLNELGKAVGLASQRPWKH